MRNENKRDPNEKLETSTVGEGVHAVEESETKASVYQSSDSVTVGNSNESEPAEMLSSETTEQTHESESNKKGKATKTDGELKKKKTSLIGLIGGVVLLSAVVGGGYFYFFNNDQFYNLVSMSDDSSPNPSAKEMEKMKMELQNLRTELDQYIGVNESVEEMENQIISLKQRIDNVAAKLEDEIGNFELESNRRSQRLEEISQRLGQLKVTENISLETKEEVERLRVSIKEIHEQSLSSELLIAKKLEDYKQMLDLEEGKKVSVSKSEKARNQENNLDSTYGEVITKIGPLKLESIVSHGSQRVAELSDMISGAIPIIEGDQVGQYQIRKITSDSVLIESLSGDKFTLVQEG
ncbi:hypothetical protein [Vibrio sp. THAF190c]|uniref:hypothetical protein n=1 Tax=Vibrio sp. THAF190c TaxID=2587865 RepID=UPI0012688544|nr:hypothetical protein [Vibrio sp. THAF190c]QFT13434.1 hypothetical protein FIV04_26125 [Vibrio sp. THAF190c]